MTLTRYEDHSGMDLPTLGKMLASSNYFQDATDAAKAIVKVLAGAELGIGPIASMTGIYIVKGRVTMSANLMAAQIKRSGRYTYQIVEMTNEACVIAFREHVGGEWQEMGRSSFTKTDATQAGLWMSSDPWKKTPRNMLFARAMSNGAKWFCPDIFAGPVYTPDELSASTPADLDTGEVIEATYTPEPVVEPTQPATTNGAHKNGAPAPTDVAEAKKRFFARFGTPTRDTWSRVAAFLGTPKAPEPDTTERWIEVGRLMRAAIEERAGDMDSVDAAIEAAA